jgi:hypothetical protein
MALASAALSNAGMVPAPRMVVAVNTPNDGWVVLPAEGDPIEAGQPSAVNDAIIPYVAEGSAFWSHVGRGHDDETSVTWFIGGTLPAWQASPLTIVVLLEENNPAEADRIGAELLMDAMIP